MTRLSRQATSFLMTARRLGLCAVLGVPFALYVTVYSTSIAANRRSLTTSVAVRAADRGKPFLNLQDGRKTAVYYRAAGGGAHAMQSGSARALASADFDHNGTPDVVAGYATSNGGILTLQRGNPDAFAPADDSVFVRVQQGYNPDSLLPVADVIPVPVSPDFVVVGNFTGDAQNDVMVAAQGGGLYLLAGDGKGEFATPRQIALPGVVTALAAGEFRAADGFTDIAVGVAGPSGTALLIFDDAAEGFKNAIVQQPLAGEATAIEFGGLDEDPFQDVAVASGTELLVVHGWGRNQQVATTSRVEHVAVGSDLRGLAVGEFAWDRQGRSEIAALSNDGAIHIVQSAQLDSRPFTGADAAQRKRGNVTTRNVDIESAASWQPGGAAGWTESKTFPASNLGGVSFASARPLVKTNISYRETQDLLVMGGTQAAVAIVHPNGPGEGLSAAGQWTSTTLDVESSPVAMLTLPKKLNGYTDIVMLTSTSVEPIVVPNAPNTTITVDRTDDPVGVPSACTGAAGDCSLRGAVQFANNALNNNTTISIPAGTYTLSINGANIDGCALTAVPFVSSNTTGDLGLNQTMTIVGAGAATTFIKQTGTGVSNDGDRVMCLAENFALGLVFNFSGVTISGGRDGGDWDPLQPPPAQVFGGGAIIGGEKDNSLTLTNVVLSNNQATGAGLGGGAIQITGGDLTITNSTIGGTSAPSLYTDRTATATANFSRTSGGGVSFTPSAPTHTGATGVLTVTGSTLSHNTSRSGSAGGAGADVYTFAFASPGGIGTGSAVFQGNTVFQDNQSLGTASGGGLINESLDTTVKQTSFTNNSAGNRGGAIYVGGASLLLDGTNPGITMSGNTAATAGSSLSTSGAVNVSGTNTTLGGDIEVTTNGSWTNNDNSTLAPTNVIVAGGTFNAGNSTVLNIGGNLTVQSGAVVGGAFNGNSATINLAGDFTYLTGPATPTFTGGTSTFNFNGTGTQSLSNSASITFNNLTDSNTTNPLTLNNSFAVGGTLNVNGANAILSPVAAAVMSGSGTLTGTGTARASRTAATPDFLTQYTIATKILTTLTIDYNGTGNQTVNNTPAYSNLRISGSGTKTLQGNTTIGGNLNIAAATLATGNFNVAVSGNWTNSAAFTPGTGTVTFAGASGTQTLSGNTTFFNLTLNNTGATTNFGTGTTTIGNDLNATAGVMDGGTSTVIFTGVTDNTGSIGGVNPKNFFNLQINTPATISNSTGGNITIENNYTNTGVFNQAAALTTIFATDNNGDGAHTLSGAGTTLFGNVTVNGANTLDAGSHNFSVLGATFTSTGTFTGNASTVSFNGGVAQTITGDGAKNFSGLLVNNGNGVILANGAGTVDASVGGLLTLATDLTTAAGAILQQSGTSTGAADVIGTVRRTDLVVGTERVFGNLSNSITINSGTPPAQMDFNLVKATPAAFPALVKVVARDVTLTPTGGSGISSTVKLRYVDPGELSGPGITESRLILWKKIGGVWTPQGGTVDAANNFVSLPNVSSFSEWAIAEGSDLTLTKANNVGGSAVTGQSWNWTLTATNTGTPATFTAGQTILTDNLPNANLNYGAVTVQNVSNITGSANISCAISSNDLNCTANGGSVTFASNAGASHFDVVFSATPQAAGTYQNPRGGGGIAQIDPGSLIAESLENNNSATNTVTVGKASTTTAITSDTPDPSVVGQAVPVQWSVTVNGPGAVGAPLTGNVTVSDGSNQCLAAVSAGQCSVAFTSPGSKNLTATYAGDSNYNGSASSPATVHTVNKADTTTTITSDNPDSSTPGQSVAVQWTVAPNPPAGGTPTGNVTVTVSGGVETCSAAVGAGQCSLALNTIGFRTITATYAGDTSFNGSADTESHAVCGSAIVTTNADSGAGSIRQIIADACDGAIITFDLGAGAHTISLTSGELLFNKNLTIAGPGADLLTIERGSGNARVMHVTSGGTVLLRGVTIANGSATAVVPAIGGGILNENSNLTITSSVISGNTAQFGGGIYTIGDGAAASLTLINSTVATNTSTGDGAAIFNSGANGGTGTLTVANSTISGNNAAGGGAGLWNTGTAAVTITNATISNNRINATGTTPLAGGGGVLNQSSTPVILANTIVAKNVRDPSPSTTEDDATGAFDAAQSINNLLGEGDNALNLSNGTNGNQIGTVASPIDPKLGPLASNGGATQTHALLSDSPAIEAGDNAAAAAAGLTTDQRGFARLADSLDAGTTDTVDIGAFEAAAFLATLADTLTPEDTFTTVTFDVADADLITAITATSNNTTLVPNDLAHLSVSGAGTTRTLKITPAADLTGTADITVTVTSGSDNASDTLQVTVTAVADTPSVTNTTTIEDTQSTGGLVVSRNAADGVEVSHLKITNITGGSLFLNDGTTAIANGTFITFAEGNAGLKFTPAPDSNVTGHFSVQSSIGGSDLGVGGAPAIADIFITPTADTPSVTSATTNEDTQNTTGLVIAPNVVDGATVTHYKITGITGGLLFQNDGSTPIGENTFITAAQGTAGLKFTPAADSILTGHFAAQASVSNVDAGLGGNLANADIFITPIGDAPGITSATTNEDTQSLSGLVLSRNAVDGAEVTHFKITAITNGSLFKNDGTTPIANGDVITFAEGNAGLKFTPTANFFGNASFIAQGATSAAGAGTGAGTTAAITADPVADTPSVSHAGTLLNTQTTSGLVISRNAVDGAEVTHFKVTGITGGTLFQNDGTTPVVENDFITVAQGNAGLKFTPALNSQATGHFSAQASLNPTDLGLGGGLATADIFVFGLPPTVSVTTSATPVSFGQPVTFTATVSPIGAGTNATVQFRDGGVALGAPITLTSGIATLTTSALAPGGHIITAEYSGNDLYQASIGALVGGQYVKPPTTIVVGSAPNPSAPGTAATFTATVTPTSATGTITFREGPATLGTVPLADGVATFTTSSLATGPHTIVADYSGDSAFSPSSGSVAHVVGCPTITVAPATLSAPAFGLPYGPITFTQIGGIGATTFALTGPLPTGLAFNAPTATLSGTPTSTGTFTVTVTATDANGCTGSRSYTFTVATTIAMSATPSVVNFGAVANGASVSPVTPPQSITLTQASGTPIAWTVSVDQPWLSVSPTSGSGAGIVTVSIVNPPAPDNLPATGARTGTITFTTTGAANSPTVAVNLTLLTAAQLTGPIGSFDTPANGQTNVTGSIGVTGWAVDDLGATTVEIWRAPIAGEGAEVFLGFGTFVTGARPDIAALFPTTPYFQRAGWGYLLLTNMLPNQGNGTFTLRAYAKDVETNRVLLGQKTITCTNATATAPFGAIDTPEPGGTASGTLLNFGWVLAAQPTASGLFIPIDGSTIHVFVDGVDRGAVDSYNNPRPDIQALFPGYFNTDGAVGVKFVDTTTFANGTHTIAWLATDNPGNAAGIGSRFFTIANSAAMATTIAAPTLGTGEPDVVDASTAVAGSTTDLEAIDRSNTAIAVRHGFDDQAAAEIVTPDAAGVHTVRVAPLDRLAIELGPAHEVGATYRGYVIDGDTLRALPIGSTLDPHTGEFVWTPGVGFGGTHELVFVRDAGGGKQQIRITVTIANP